jgi:polyisoprenoid-binding protein YceI
MLVPVCARLLRISILLPLAPALALSLISSRPAAAQDAAFSIDIHGGSIAFDVATNMPAISVHGKSTALEGHARVRQTDGGLAIDQLEATVPIASLATGMGLRDAHMRKYVFTSADGQTPDLRFDASHADCTRAGGRDMICQLSGTLAIRSIARPFAITLRVSESGAGGGALHAAGDAQIALSGWQIDRPSQLGVRTADEVKLHIEFATRPAASITTTAANRGGR